MSLLISPTIKRPQFHIFGQNRNVIKGAGAHRCTFCGALLTGKEEFCNVCNSSTISKNAEQNGRRVNDAPIWKKRFRDCGQPNGGYES